MKTQSGVKTALDEKISEIRRNTSMSGFLLEPNLVRHIGYRSSLGEEHQKVTGVLNNWKYLTFHKQGRDNGDLREFLVNYPI